METAQPYCSELSLKAAEPLFATATPTRLYLLLEYDGSWENKALEESDLPDAVKKGLKDFTRTTPEAKLLLIRRDKPTSRSSSVPAGSAERQAPAGLKSIGVPGTRMLFYFAVADQGSSLLYKFSLENYQQLLEIELENLASGESQYEAFQSSERLALVCTNGRRDRCCARFGTAVYQALHQENPEGKQFSLWHSSHMGGHRFAANLLLLPEGLLYGRVDPSSGIEIVNEHLQSRLHLPNLRGRSIYPPAAQAAEHFLRQRTGDTGINSYKLVDCREVGGGLWQVEFNSSQEERLTVNLSEHVSETTVFESCSLDKMTKIRKYQLIE